MEKQQRYNMHGYMIEFDPQRGTWNWSKWDYRETNGKKQVVRHSGPLQFKRMFRSLLEGGSEPINARNAQELDQALQEKGVEFIFLFQGITEVDDRFETVEEAGKYFQLDACPHWDLTDYWFDFNREINSWAMYDTYSGDLQFTPGGVMSQRTQSVRRAAQQRPYQPADGFYRERYSVVH